MPIVSAHNPAMDVSAHTRANPPDGGTGDGTPDAGGDVVDIEGLGNAAAAGVSYQTISRVINGSPNVRRSTREHVLARGTPHIRRPVDHAGDGLVGNAGRGGVAQSLNIYDVAARVRRAVTRAAIRRVRPCVS